MPEMKRTVKDSVFTCLFSDPKYARELYLYLHPEDTDITEADCKLITIENILSDGQYNDLSLLIRGTLIILGEAQSTFCPNLPMRMLLLYIAQNYKTYIAKRRLRLYSSTPVPLPRAELYMVYSGHRKDIPDILRLSDLCGEGSIEVMVKVLRGGDDSIVGQYVEFCRIADEQRIQYGPSKQAVQETIRICLERGVLVPFLTDKREEVVDIMDLLFSQEEIWEMDRQYILQEGIEKGRREGRHEVVESLKRLAVQGRMGDQLAAIAADSDKFSELVRELGLE